MREWPSLVPGAPEGYYIVINRYGRFGTAFAETNLDRADYETTIADLIAGQHSDPLRVVRFNPDADRAGDVSPAVAREILRRLDLEGAQTAVRAEGLHRPPRRSGRQLTLRLPLGNDQGRFA